jgi:hypothetical protein
MDEGVLSRKIEALRANTTGTKDFAVVVKPLKRVVQGSKAACIMYVTSSEIAKFYKSSHCLHCLVWYIAFDCW